MSKINKLTAGQEAAIPGYVQRWIALADTPLDREKACEAICEIYREMGKKEPIILFAQSPMQASLMETALRQLSKNGEFLDLHRERLCKKLGYLLRKQIECGQSNHLTGEYARFLDGKIWSRPQMQTSVNRESPFEKPLDDQLWIKMWKQLQNELWDQMWRQLEGWLWDELDDQTLPHTHEQLGRQLGFQLGDQLRSQVSCEIWHTLVSRLWDRLRFQLREQLWSQLAEHLENIPRLDRKIPYLPITWAGLYDFCKTIGVVFDERKLNLFLKFAEQAQFVLSYRGVAIVSEKPVKINWLNSRLHSHHEMSVQYGDGWGIYSWRGISVPEKYIKYQAQITREDIINEKNIERRRCLREILGARRFTELLGLEEVHRDKVASGEAILWRTREKDELIRDHLQFIEVCCPSTGREYMLCVPPHIRDCWSAVAWTFGKERKEDYAPLIET